MVDREFLAGNGNSVKTMSTMAATSKKLPVVADFSFFQNLARAGFGC